MLTDASMHPKSNPQATFPDAPTPSSSLIVLGLSPDRRNRPFRRPFTKLAALVILKEPAHGKFTILSWTQNAIACVTPAKIRVLLAMRGSPGPLLSQGDAKIFFHMILKTRLSRQRSACRVCRKLPTHRPVDAGVAGYSPEHFAFTRATGSMPTLCKPVGALLRP